MSLSLLGDPPQKTSLVLRRSDAESDQIAAQSSFVTHRRREIELQNDGLTRRDAYLLEVIVCSLEDALAAKEGDADRLEVVRELDRGGLTPSLNLVRQIKEATQLPLRVMLREDEQHTLSSHKRLKSLRTTLSEVEGIGVDGVVLGFLRKGEVDLEAMTEVLNVAPHMAVTFHHAFDETRSPLEALDLLRELPQVDRVLTSGGGGDVFERAARLESYREAASDAITVLAGGGVDESVLRVLLEKTSIREFHVGRAARHPIDAKVKASLVGRLKEVLRSADGEKLGAEDAVPGS